MMFSFKEARGQPFRGEMLLYGEALETSGARRAPYNVAVPACQISGGEWVSGKAKAKIKDGRTTTPFNLRFAFAFSLSPSPFP
jgi:hypothetical protein